jgi:mono/diheme cytochrome c family protein
VRRLSATIAIASSALLIAACGSEGVSVSEGDGDASAGAEIFATHCAGCHTLGAAGTQGSGNRALRAQGPNFDQRVETYDEALFAIRNGGFSGAIMPQNIVVGEDANLVAKFLADYSGGDVEEPPRPSQDSGDAVATGQGDASGASIDPAGGTPDGAGQGSAAGSGYGAG